MTAVKSKAPTFTSIPSLYDISQESVELSVSLDMPGTVHYWVQYAAMLYMSQTGLGLSHDMVVPVTAEMNNIAADQFKAGIVANGSFSVYAADQLVKHTIKPPCIGDLCKSFLFALFPFTSYQVKSTSCRINKEHADVFKIC